MPEFAFAIPGDLAARTGGYEYDRRLLALLPQQDWRPLLLAWPDGFPFPDEAAVGTVERSLAAVGDGTLVLIDGLAFGVLPELARKEARRLRLVALVHHPLALESGLSEAERQRLADCERSALAQACGVIVTSPTTAKALAADYAVPQDRIRVAVPGTDACPPPIPRVAPGVLEILSVGAVIPRKGYDLLVAALQPAEPQAWHLTIIGSLVRDPACVDALRRQITAAGLQDRIALLGEVADLAPHYDAADLFALASRHEGYGMVFAEALRHGLPIIGTRAGAIPELVPEEAGLLVPPEDVPALTKALMAMRDEGLRARCAAAAARAGAALPPWQDTARAVAEALHAFSA